MLLSDFDYPLPEGLIAQLPEKERDHSRLMILQRDSGATVDKRFCELKEFLKKGDLLIINDTRVFPARLIGKRETGGRVEVFLLEHLSRDEPRHLLAEGEGRGRIGAVPTLNILSNDTFWKVLIRSSKRPRPDEAIIFDKGIKAVVKEEAGEGVWNLLFNSDPNRFWNVLEKIGKTPLPPYIKRPKGDISLEHIDRERYQTVFAKNRGAVAAPTAGLHFTAGLLDALTEQGVTVLPITLHIGWGTFRPVRIEDIREHSMHPEYYEIKSEVVKAVTRAKRMGSRVVAVGTSVVRVLEHVLGSKPLNGGDSYQDRLEVKDHCFKGYTDLFIFPGFKFKVVDAMITNFHLPKSTLLMLVSAFAGRANIMVAYKKAISKGYKFYSYGDAMLIL